MKQFYTLLIAFATGLSCFSASLTPQEALQRATESGRGRYNLRGLHSSPQLAMTGTTSDGNPAYYIFTDDSSTLIVSADDIALPLLGYCDSGNFDSANMAEGLKWWLSEYANEIGHALKQTAPSTGRLKSESSTGTSRLNGNSIAPMIQTTWSQSEPFNNYCPVIGGKHASTGCVATSMAQVMKYFEWPKSPVDPISYEFNGETLVSPITTFDWPNMLNSYKGTYSTAQADAVARLMQLAGYSVSMNYRDDGASTQQRYARNALIEKFGYDIGAYNIERNYYSTEEWEQAIYDNLANIGPVIYDGQGSGGHSFVCDGYDGNGMFHMNWGWGGKSDGYFVLSALTPGDHDYSTNQKAILGIRPPKADSTAPEPPIGCSTSITTSISGRKLTIAATNDGGYWNIGDETATFSFGLNLEDIKTGDSYQYTILTKELAANHGYKSLKVDIPDTLPFGDYEARPIYKVDDGDWKLIRFKNDAVDYFTINVSENGITIGSTLIFLNWEVPAVFKRDNQYEGHLTMRNDLKFDQKYSLKAYLCSNSYGSFSIEAAVGSESIIIPANSQVDIPISLMLSKNLDARPYYIVLYEGSKALASEMVKVLPNGELVCGEFQPNPSSLYRNELSEVTVTVYNESEEDKNEEFKLSIYRFIRSWWFEHTYGSVEATIPAGSEQKISFSTIIPEDIDEDEVYLVLKDKNNKILDFAPVHLDNNPPSEVKVIEDTDEHEKRYFNMQGIEIRGNNLTPGLYIIKKGNKSSKIIVK